MKWVSSNQRLDLLMGLYGKDDYSHEVFNKFSCNRKGVKYICDSDRITIGMIINIHRNYFITAGKGRRVQTCLCLSPEKGRHGLLPGRLPGESRYLGWETIVAWRV